ncbi:MAG: acyl-CoA dehydrogenase [Burkholderiaceae bacterium]|nr:acyl-CoA dehydrogenase [Burkholderiaceae bacterium]MDO9091009.1 acyl-CoA dehydrogenase [Burkholderiaceae bacterium]
MDFALTHEQTLFQESLRRLLQNDAGAGLWARFAELGLLALPFSPEQGGIGAGPEETQIAMEEIGRALSGEPYLATVVLAGGILRRVTDQTARIAAIAEGSLRMALAHTEPAHSHDRQDVTTRAVRDDDGWRIDGAKRLVIGGDVADSFIVSAQTGAQPQDLRLFIVDARSSGLTRSCYATFDGMRVADLSFQNLHVPADHLIDTQGDAAALIERVIDEATAAVCAEAVGVMESAYRLTLEYIGTRKQFGVAIGSFQSLRHRAADMYIALEQSRSMAVLAMLRGASDDTAVRRRAVSSAKVQIGRAGRELGQHAIQLHGAIGMTDEYKAGHLFKRLIAIEKIFGDTAAHLERLIHHEH